MAGLLDALKQYVRDASPGGLLNPEIPPGAPTEFAKGLLGFAPVIGDAISGYEAVQAARQGNYGDAALNAVGVLPFVPSMAGVIKQTGNLGKSGLPAAIKRIPGPLPDPIDATKLRGASNADSFGSVWPKNAEGMLNVKPIEGGGYVMTGMGLSHISNVRPFYAVGDDATELAQYGINRLENSSKSIQAARTAKVPKDVRAKLESQFGKNFAYDISNASNSGSYYITHTPSGTKIRVSDHDLPGYYENTAHIDIRPNEVADLPSLLADFLK